MQMQVNLLPIQYRPKPAVRLWPVLTTIVLMLNLLIISSYWLSIQLEVTSAETSLSNLRSEVSTLERRVEEGKWKTELAAAVDTKSEFIELHDGESILWHPMLKIVESAMVPGVTIAGLSTSATGQISIGGTTETLTDVANFLGSLQNEIGLEQVRLLGATPGGQFQISMTGWSGREVQEDDE